MGRRGRVLMRKRKVGVARRRLGPVGTALVMHVWPVESSKARGVLRWITLLVPVNKAGAVLTHLAAAKPLGLRRRVAVAAPSRLAEIAKARGVLTVV